MYQLGVRVDNGVYFTDRDTGGDSAKVCVADLFDIIFPESIHDLPLGRYTFGIPWNNHLHRNCTQNPRKPTGSIEEKKSTIVDREQDKGLCVSPLIKLPKIAMNTLLQSPTCSTCQPPIVCVPIVFASLYSEYIWLQV